MEVFLAALFDFGGGGCGGVFGCHVAFVGGDCCCVSVCRFACGGGACGCPFLIFGGGGGCGCTGCDCGRPCVVAFRRGARFMCVLRFMHDG